MMCVPERRVVIVDDHPTLRKGLRGLLARNTNISVVGEAGSGEQALDTIAETRPDLVIVDIVMRGMDGLELTRRLKEIFPEVKVLILSVHNESRYVRQAMQAGASGYVLKESVNEIVEYATRKVLAGEQYFSRELTDEFNT